MIYDGAADEKHQNNDFHCAKLDFLYFWTCQFVKFESKHSFKLRKLQLPKEFQISFVSVYLLLQMTGLSLYVEKVAQS